jgi:hypothetical protein
LARNDAQLNLRIIEQVVHQAGFAAERAGQRRAVDAL